MKVLVALPPVVIFDSQGFCFALFEGPERWEEGEVRFEFDFAGRMSHVRLMILFRFVIGILTVEKGWGRSYC